MRLHYWRAISIIICVAILSGCTNSNLTSSKIVGKWLYEDGDTVIFRGTGIYEMYSKGSFPPEEAGIYSIKGNKIIFDSTQHEPMELTGGIDKNTLSLTKDGKTDKLIKYDKNSKQQFPQAKVISSDSLLPWDADPQKWPDIFRELPEIRVNIVGVVSDEYLYVFINLDESKVHAYTNELYNFIKCHKIDYWQYGREDCTFNLPGTHWNYTFKSDFSIDETYISITTSDVQLYPLPISAIKSWLTVNSPTSAKPANTSGDRSEKEDKKNNK